ncbi:4'-phosphopantetheinyl transferase superfamily protein [Actinospica durhamensis]|uniref:4'-phosphopantetheinyl transferase superfamily protein n=1 Tax=Actinospica durhamensis TaxID=1508375 RepID=A0A941EV03_9ACTN|nr:4'-phosphopantetheinyl transferase superfamily protein [Actinospica durhamensis]MBR7835539.1 4'-phosphopantetheinyl transferase superfamily protein [Actinospica durhamensis]
MSMRPHEGADADVVHVWLAGDDVPEPALTRMHALLDAEEQRRAAAFLRPDHRRRFIVAHAAARSIVGARLGVPAEQIRWRIGPHGKPSVAGPHPGPDSAPRAGIEVNLSHSGSLCAVAVSATRPVGVDVQRLCPGMDVAAMARRYFAAPEVAFVLADTSPEVRSSRFIRLWARKEAMVKAAGGRLLRGMPVSVLDRSVVDFDDRAHRLADLTAPAGFHAAVALGGDRPYHVVESWWSSR